MSDKAMGSLSQSNTKENKSKENRTKEERENECEENILFSLSDNLQEKFIFKYVEHLISKQEYIKSETAFVIKIKKQLAKQDKEQLEDLKEWYLITECERLKDEYVSKRVGFNYKGTCVYIKDIYPYFKTNGFVKDNLIYMSFENKEIDILGFNSVEELESFIDRNKMLVIT